MLVALILLSVGFFAVFKPKKLIDLMTSLVKNNSLNERLQVNKMIEKRWFYPNLRLCGVLLILMSIVLLIINIKTIFG
jgi:hypothetical protein